MMPAAQGHPALVGDRDDIMRVNATQAKNSTRPPAPASAQKAGCRASPPACHTRRRPVRVVPRNGLQPDAVQVIQRRAQPHRVGEIRRAGLELVRNLLPRAAEKIDACDHVAAALERRHFLQLFLPAVERADASRSANFVPGKSQKIAADFLHVDRRDGRALGGVHQRDDAALPRARAQFQRRD